MNDIDKKIQAALRGESPAGSAVDQPNLAEDVLSAFRGRYRWLSTVMLIVQLVAVAFFVVAATKFYNAADMAVQLRWGGLALVLFQLMALLKIWFWLELQSSRTLREVKRVELMLVSQKQM